MKRKLLLLAVFVFTGACGDKLPPPAGESLSNPPGSTAWYDDNIQCQSVDDCRTGEVCVDNLCRLQRCTEKVYPSDAPMGKLMYFYADKEIMVTRGGSDARRIETYEPLGDTFVSPDQSALWVEGAEPTDIAGGNFLGTLPEVLAVVQEGKNSVRFLGDDVDQEMKLTVFPSAIATGDMDHDGVMEFGVASREGAFEICSAVTGTCSHSGNLRTISGVDVLVDDVTMADVDADGRAELLFVGRTSSSSSNFVVGVYNPDHRESGQPELVQKQEEGEGNRIGAADLDGDRIAEILVLDHGNKLWKKDKVHQMKVTADEISKVDSVELDGRGIDILASDLDSDDRAEVMVLTDNDRVEVFTRAGAATLHRSFTTGLSMTKNATRLATIDRDSDSPYGELLEGPKLLPGDLVPTMVSLYPPYSKEFSDGRASTLIGRGEEHGETKSEGVSLNASAWVELTVGISESLSALVASRVSTEVEHRKSVSKFFEVWEWFQLTSTPSVEGLYNGGVQVACGCFHTYKYKVQAPKGDMIDLGDTMDVVVPVGGQAHTMSIGRYNAMAKALGDMPIIPVPYMVGDPSSYPTIPETLEGEVIYKDDLVIEPRLYRVSDTAGMTWLYFLSEGVANSVSRRVTISAYTEEQAKFKIPLIGSVGVLVGAEAGIGTGVGYEIMAGTTTTFGGNVPAVRDDPDTPEDEFTLHSYGFTPVVYRHRYTTRSGDEAGYFVQTFAVTP